MISKSENVFLRFEVIYCLEHYKIKSNSLIFFLYFYDQIIIYFQAGSIKEVEYYSASF